MGYEVISRFYDRAADRYVAPGAPCPPLDPDTAARLVRAGCLVAVPNPAPPMDDPPAPQPLRRKSGGRATESAGEDA